MSGLKTLDYKDNIEHPIDRLHRLCARSKSLREATGEELAKKVYAMMDSGEIDHLLCCEIAERLRALTEIENTKRSR